MTLSAMKVNNTQELTFRTQSPGEDVPWALLLEADPSRELVQGYLAKGTLWRLQLGQKLLGIYVLMETEPGIGEVMNISVAEAVQGQGYGAALLRHATEQARKLDWQMLHICTADASVRQQKIYEKAGFKKVGVVPDFFIKHYPEPLFDQGKQCRDQIVMEKSLTTRS